MEIHHQNCHSGTVCSSRWVIIFITNDMGIGVMNIGGIMNSYELQMGRRANGVALFEVNDD